MSIERAERPYGFFLPLGAVTLSLCWSNAPPGSFRVGVFAQQSLLQSWRAQQPLEATPSKLAGTLCHHPGEQGDPDGAHAALGSTARMEAWRPPREGTSAGTLCQHPGLLQPLHEQPQLLSNSTSPSVMLSCLVNPDEPRCLSLSLTTLWIALVSSKGGGKKIIIIKKKTPNIPWS